MEKLRYYCLLLLLLISLSSRATHIVGGEMNYTYISGSTYQVKLTLYRDCFNGQAPYDNPASIGVFDKFNNLLFNVLVTVNDSSLVPPTLSSPCLVPPTNICYRVAHYIANVSLPPRAGGYKLVYMRCCRNGSILNINNPGLAGATYMATVPDPGQAANNSNPVIKNWPSTFICANEPYVFDHSATDKDGDSLVYTLCDPVHGPNSACYIDLMCCVNNGGIQPCGVMPQPPFNPPYITTSWKAPYSSANVFGGVPLTINPKTGIMTCTPNTLGQFVYAVCVREYRNGVYIGETYRDFQVNIVNCPKLTVAALAATSSVCGNLTAKFLNNSSGASAYKWDFGDSTVTSDTSSLASPSYTYTDSGYYKIRLIAYSSLNNACNDTSYSSVTLYPPLKTDFSITSPPCSNVVTFHDSASKFSGSITSVKWDFGDGTSATTSNPTHTYSSVGIFTVKLTTTSSKGCVDTVTKTIDLTSFNADFNYTVGCSDSVYFADTLNLFNDTANTFSWNFGDNTTASTTDPFHIYSGPGQYPVSLIITTSRGCTDTIQKTVTVSSLAADFTYSGATCAGPISFQDNSVQLNDPIISWDWDFGDGTTASASNPNHSYTTAGNYNITYITTTAKGCRDTISKKINLARLNADFNYVVGCNDSVAFTEVLNLSNDTAKTLSWNFGDNNTSGGNGPLHVYSTPGPYSVSLIITTNKGCTDTITKSINVTQLVADFIYNNAPCSATVTLSDNSSQAGDPVNAWDWDFGDGDTAMTPNPVHIYKNAGSYTITYTATTVKGCKDLATKPVNLLDSSKALFSPTTQPCRPEVRMNNASFNGFSYQWNFGDGATSTEANPVHVYDAEGTYTVKLVINAGSFCNDSSEQTVKYDMVQIMPHFMPNAFTPNGDGLNDKFIVTGQNICEAVKLIVFNRWGNIIFETEAVSEGWDGKINGEIIPDGVYVYILEGEGWNRYGTVTVSR